MTVPMEPLPLEPAAGATTGFHRYRVINGVRLHYVEYGRGPLVVLLHGFPEFWYAWRYQIPALAEAGFRVIALDQRGYNTSAKPPGVTSYRLEVLLEDVRDLIRTAGEDRAVVVGHDWGGAIDWHFAMRYPEAVDRPDHPQCPATAAVPGSTANLCPVAQAMVRPVVSTALATGMESAGGRLCRAGAPDRSGVFPNSL